MSKIKTRETRNLLSDVQGILVGNAEDESARTGVTVIYCPDQAVAAVEILGGGPGTRETDALAAHNLVERIDAITLAGGSVYGLAAADGVTAVLGANGKGFGLMDLPGVPRSPIVPAAILYDLANGGEKNWGKMPPYRQLGEQALANADTSFSLGNAGAGYGALAGALKGGLGSASYQSNDGFGIAALVAVNCFGSTLVPGSHQLWAAPFEQDNEFCLAGRAQLNPQTSGFPLHDWGSAKVNPGARQNTSLAVVATDLPLSSAQTKRMAQMAASGLSRAIRPVAAPFDGDVVFALSTDQAANMAPKQVDDFLLAQLGSLAADCLSRAVGRAMVEAKDMAQHRSLGSQIADDAANS